MGNEIKFSRGISEHNKVFGFFNQTIKIEILVPKIPEELQMQKNETIATELVSKPHKALASEILDELQVPDPEGENEEKSRSECDTKENG